MQSQSFDPRGTPGTPDSEKNISSLGDTPSNGPAAVDATGPHASDRAAGASMRRALDDADEVGRMTADAEPHHQEKPESKAAAALKAGKSYAESAVNSAGRKMEDVKYQAAELKQRGMQYVAHEPWKAAACAAAAGGVLTAMLMSWVRGRR